jgi:hypothetical protein
MNDQTVVLLVSDLMSGTRIESILASLNLNARQLVAENYTSQVDESYPENKPGEPVSGPSGRFVDQITSWHPSLIIIDLGDSAGPWESWLAILKSSPATRRIPIIAFGPHIDVESLKRAESLNADVVVPRSRFFNQMSALISDAVILHNKEEFLRACQEALSDSALIGLQEFNRGRYFEAHEYLEDAWNEDANVGRNLYRAVLQVAVAYLQIERGNYVGAVKMILRSRQWFAPLPDICRGINVAQLQNDAENVYNILTSTEPGEISDFDMTLLKPVQMIG